MYLLLVVLLGLGVILHFSRLVIRPCPIYLPTKLYYFLYLMRKYKKYRKQLPTVIITYLTLSLSRPIIKIEVCSQLRVRIFTNLVYLLTQARVWVTQKQLRKQIQSHMFDFTKSPENHLIFFIIELKSI